MRLWLIALLFSASLLGPAYMRYYPFRHRVTTGQKKQLRHGHLVIFFLQTALIGLAFSTGTLPVTHAPGHGLGMRSLARFQDKYGASVLCRVKNGQFSTYLQVDTAVRT